MVSGKKEIGKWLLRRGKISKNEDRTEILQIQLEMEKYIFFFPLPFVSLSTSLPKKLSFYYEGVGVHLPLCLSCLLTELTPLPPPPPRGPFLRTFSLNFRANILICLWFFFQTNEAIPYLLQQRKQHRHMQGNLWQAPASCPPEAASVRLTCLHTFLHGHTNMDTILFYTNRSYQM